MHINISNIYDSLQNGVFELFTYKYCTTISSCVLSVMCIIVENDTHGVENAKQGTSRLQMRMQIGKVVKCIIFVEYYIVLPK